MKAAALLLTAALAAFMASGCKQDTIVDREAARAQTIEAGATEKCAVCQRDFPEGSLKARAGQRLCGSCIDAQSG